MSGGLTSTGFVAKTIEELLADIGAEQLSTIDPALDISPDQPLGQINGIFSKKLAEIWEALATAYNAFNRAAAEGNLLDAIGLLTGTIRLPATKSTVTCTVGLSASTTLSAGAVANVSGQPSTRFVLVTSVTSTTAGNYSAEFEAEVTGPVPANSGTLTVITTPASGWLTVTNSLDAALGTDIETDAAYRLRQVAELASPGACTVDAIRADVLRVPGVLQAFVFENTTMTTDGDGVPPKAFETVLYDGAGLDADNPELAQVIWDNKPAGIETYGATGANATDSLGVPRAVEFSRATVKTVYLTYTLDVDPLHYPADGDAQVKAAAIAKGLTYLNLGIDVVALVFRAQALLVEGVNDVTSFTLGFTATPVGTSNLTIGSREIGVLDTSRIVVNS